MSLPSWHSGRLHWICNPVLVRDTSVRIWERALKYNYYEKFFKKYIRLFKYKQIKSADNPIRILEDCVSQLSALYAYQNGKDYRESQRDILNLRLAEIKHEINKQLKYLVC